MQTYAYQIYAFLNKTGNVHKHGNTEAGMGNHCCR